MSLRARAGTGVLVLLVLAVLAMVVGQALGQPVLLGFVATGSMAPTLDAGDGFVAIPPSLAGEIEQDDIVTFDARELHDGGLTTHRVVGETGEGYITKGDANPFTDQDGSEPLVTDGQIRAVTLQVNGEVVRIPHLGTVALGLRGAFGALLGALGFLPGIGRLAESGIGMIMVGLGLALLGVSVVTDVVSSGRDTARRSRKRPGVMNAALLLVVILLLVLIPVTASMVIPSGTLELGIVSSQSPSAEPTVIGVGESQEITYTITNEGLLPKVIVLEPASPGLSVSESVLVVPRGQTAETTVTVTAPDETGFYLRHLSERHYLQFLPTSVIVALHEAHPWFAMLAINAGLGAVVTIIFVASVGMEPLRLRETKRDVSIAYRIRRSLRRWL